MYDRLRAILKNEEKVHDVLYIGIVVLVATASFFVGRLSVVESIGGADEAHIVIDPSAKAFVAPPVISGASGAGRQGSGEAVSGKEALVPPDATSLFVASKNGTKYYSKGCKSASRIKPENAVWYSSREEAESAGKSPSSTCQDL